jgi:hypothetical protein
MITTAPLPGFGQLLWLRYLSQPNGNQLGQPWLKPNDLGGIWLSRSAWSLAVLADAAQRARGHRPVVALPDYICNGSLGPLRALADLVFYGVKEDLSPDWNTCRDLPRLDLFVLVHYFGRPQDVAEARRFCNRRTAWLIEDAAHVLRPMAGVGEAGDAVLYSPHKLLAVPDGAILVARPTLGAVEHHLVDAVKAGGWAHPPTTGWRFKKLLQISPLGPWLMRRHPGGQPDFQGDPDAAPLPRTPMISVAAGALIARADLDAVAAARRANAQALSDAVLPLADWRPLLAPRPDVAPYRLVMRAKDEETASAIYARLRAAHLPVESWPDLPPEAGAGSVARRLRRSVLLLPCHQGCRAEELAAAYGGALA